MRMRLWTVVAATSVVALASWAAAGSAPGPRLKWASVILEQNVTNGDCALIVEADAADPLRSLDVRDASGTSLLRTQARPNVLSGLGGMRLETSDGPLSELLTRRPEGDYTFVARTQSGQLSFGVATLSHALPEAPTILWPTVGAAAAASDLTLSWSGDPQTLEYQLGLEQGDTDTMIVRVSGDTSQLRVPAGVLRSGEPAKFELIAVGRNGNRTAVEVEFDVR